MAGARRPQAAALVAALADPDRGWDAIVIGEYECAFHGGQYASMAPLFEHYGIQLWTPEVGSGQTSAPRIMRRRSIAGVAVKREIAWTKIPVRTAMATQAREQGRYLDGRPRYGYRLADAGPHPNKVHASWRRRAHRLEPDPATAPVAARMFAQRLAWHSVADHPGAGRRRIPCPSAADPEWNPHRTGRAWTLSTVAAILANPRLHRAAGVEPAAHRLRPRRPRQHRAGPPAGVAVEPARRTGDLRPTGPSADRQRRRPVPAGRAAALRHMRAVVGIGLVQRQAHQWVCAACANRIIILADAGMWIWADVRGRVTDVEEHCGPLLNVGSNQTLPATCAGNVRNGPTQRLTAGAARESRRPKRRLAALSHGRARRFELPTPRSTTAHWPHSTPHGGRGSTL